MQPESMIVWTLDLVVLAGSDVRQHPANFCDDGTSSRVEQRKSSFQSVSVDANIRLDVVSGNNVPINANARRQTANVVGARQDVNHLHHEYKKVRECHLLTWFLRRASLNRTYLRNNSSGNDGVDLLFRRCNVLHQGTLQK